MLTPLPNSEETSRNLRRERRLWHEGTRHTPSIGCTKCPDQAVCGGLQLAGALFDCDAVCRYKPDEFARRVREVGGFLFDNVPRAPVLTAPSLPALIPLLYHGSKRVVPFQAPAVCLPLYSVIQRHNGETRYANAAHLARGFGIAKNVQVRLDEFRQVSVKRIEALPNTESQRTR